ncbi:MAG TPA: histidine phosphatase family protein [Gaiellaceae bacterium]|nr:histidine phosphatase family protein [Gaiellaceae bacterium]
MTTTILLARHGESDWNRTKRWQGWADRPLTDRGRDQARELAARLADTELDAVYASDLQRARETAEIAAGTKNLTVHTTPDLREVDVGSWSGLTRPEAEERFPDQYARWLEGGEGWEDGETYEQLGERVVKALNDIAVKHDSGRVLLVAHGGTIRAIHAAALGVDIHTYRRIQRVEPNATLSAVCVEDGRLTELCRTENLDEFLVRDQARRREAALRPPTPAG